MEILWIKKNWKLINGEQKVKNLLVEPPTARIRGCAWTASTISIDFGAIILPIERTEVLSIMVCHRIQWFIVAAKTINHQIVFISFGINAKYVIVEFDAVAGPILQQNFQLHIIIVRELMYKIVAPPKFAVPQITKTVFIVGPRSIEALGSVRLILLASLLNDRPASAMWPKRTHLLVEISTGGIVIRFNRIETIETIATLRVVTLMASKMCWQTVFCVEIDAKLIAGE